jgi:hypothetical protein
MGRAHGRFHRYQARYLESGNGKFHHEVFYTVVVVVALILGW